jgi:HlyD family secretion protein
MHRRAWLFAIVGGGAVVAGAVWLALRGPRPLVVDIEPSARRDLFRSYVTASGEIVASRFADIGSSVMGKIVNLTVAEGDRVRAGQTLARIDPVQAQGAAAAAAAGVAALEADEQAAHQMVQAAASDLAQVQARAIEASKHFERVRGLQAEGLATAADLDTARAGTDGAAAQVAAAKAAVSRAEQAMASSTRRIVQAKAQLRQADDILSKTEIRAPIDGIVSRLRVRLGEMVVIGIQNQPGTTLMTVSDLGTLDAEVRVAEADVLRVVVGGSARVTLEAAPGREFSGRVAEVGASALPVVGAGTAAREFRVVVRLDTPDPGLRPGLTCDAEILTSEKRNVVTVPLQSVVLRRPADGTTERSGVFEVKNGRAVFVPVTAGIIGGLDVEVSGVEAGLPVVVGPFQVLRDLKDGMPVRSNGGT